MVGGRSPGHEGIVGPSDFPTSLEARVIRFDMDHGTLLVPLAAGLEVAMTFLFFLDDEVFIVFRVFVVEFELVIGIKGRVKLCVWTQWGMDV